MTTVAARPEIFSQLDAVAARAVEIRHGLHRQPELGYQEKLTSAAVCRELERLGVPFERGVAGGGGGGGYWAWRRGAGGRGIFSQRERVGGGGGEIGKGRHGKPGLGYREKLGGGGVGGEWGGGGVPLERGLGGGTGVVGMIEGKKDER